MDLYSGCRRSWTGKEKTNSSPTGSTSQTKGIQIILFLFLLQAVAVKAQNHCQLEIRSPQHIFVGIGDTLVRKVSAFKFSIDSIYPGTLSLWIITDNDYQKGHFEIGCEAGKKYSYQVELGEKVHLELTGETEIDTLAPLKPATSKSKKSKRFVDDPHLDDRPYPDLTLDELFQRINRIGYSGKTGCDHVISDIMFGRELEHIKSQLFESDRVSLSKRLIVNTCLMSSHLGKLMELSDFDDTRLQLVKVAKDHVYDVENLPKLANKFALSSQREKFLKSLQEQ